MIVTNCSWHLHTSKTVWVSFSFFLEFLFPFLSFFAKLWVLRTAHDIKCTHMTVRKLFLPNYHNLQHDTFINHIIRAHMLTYFQVPLGFYPHSIKTIRKTFLEGGGDIIFVVTIYRSRKFNIIAYIADYRPNCYEH